jgi:hypothetical protein
METVDSYLNRKQREISVLSSCLVFPPDLQKPASAADVIEQKFRLAAAIKAERSLQNWSIIETARSPTQGAQSGAFEFSYGYQRADLHVHGPAIYRALGSPSANVLQETIYTSSGMSAMAALLTALTRLRNSIEVLVPQGCYSETRELLESFGAHFRILPVEAWRDPRSADGITRVVLLDSSVCNGFFEVIGTPVNFDLLIFDTTCFWRSSARIERVVKWAAHANLPLALVRSHAKLDCLGVEYGRLGSIVLAAPLRGILSGRLPWIRGIAQQTNESVRLFGAAPSPSAFPPFAGTRQFERCSVMRVAAIIRNNRRMARLLAAALGGSQVSAFQHGLYLTLAPREHLSTPSAKHLAAALSDELASVALPVSHAGSFGFDFVAIEWFADACWRRNVIRVAASDIPSSLTDKVAQCIARFWSNRESSTRKSPRARPAANSVA